VQREAAALGIDNLEHGLLEDAEFDPGKTPDICPPKTLTNATLGQLDIAAHARRDCACGNNDNNPGSIQL